MKIQITGRKIIENPGFKSPLPNAQSICTHYSCFENQGRFLTLKKILGTLLFFQKAGCKKPRSLLFKKRRGSLVSPLFE
jgi:hypothetical protein